MAIKAVARFSLICFITIVTFIRIVSAELFSRASVDLAGAVAWPLGDKTTTAPPPKSLIWTLFRTTTQTKILPPPPLQARKSPSSSLFQRASSARSPTDLPAQEDGGVVQRSPNSTYSFDPKRQVYVVPVGESHSQQRDGWWSWLFESKPLRRDGSPWYARYGSKASADAPPPSSARDSTTILTTVAPASTTSAPTTQPPTPGLTQVTKKASTTKARWFPLWSGVSESASTEELGDSSKNSSTRTDVKESSKMGGFFRLPWSKAQSEADTTPLLETQSGTSTTSTTVRSSGARLESATKPPSQSAVTTRFYSASRAPLAAEGLDDDTVVVSPISGRSEQHDKAGLVQVAPLQEKSPDSASEKGRTEERQRLSLLGPSRPQRDSSKEDVLAKERSDTTAATATTPTPTVSVPHDESREKPSDGTSETGSLAPWEALRKRAPSNYLERISSVSNSTNTEDLRKGKKISATRSSSASPSKAKGWAVWPKKSKFSNTADAPLLPDMRSFACFPEEAYKQCAHLCFNDVAAVVRAENTDVPTEKHVETSSGVDATIFLTEKTKNRLLYCLRGCRHEFIDKPIGGCMKKNGDVADGPRFLPGSVTEKDVAKHLPWRRQPGSWGFSFGTAANSNWQTLVLILFASVVGTCALVSILYGALNPDILRESLGKLSLALVDFLDQFQTDEPRGAPADREDISVAKSLLVKPREEESYNLTHSQSKGTPSVSNHAFESRSVPTCGELMAAVRKALWTVKAVMQERFETVSAVIADSYSDWLEGGRSISLERAGLLGVNQAETLPPSQRYSDDPSELATLNEPARQITTKASRATVRKVPGTLAKRSVVKTGDISNPNFQDGPSSSSTGGDLLNANI